MEAPLIEVPDGTVTTPQGFRAGATDARVRDDYAQGRLDLALLYSERPSAAAAVYTQNSFLGPPLRVTRGHLADGRAQAVIANSGIANCLTGEPGVGDAKEMARLAAEKLGVAEAGIRKLNRRDLTLIELAPGSRAAGVFTLNRFCAAPVQLCKQHLPGGGIRALVINTGVANAGTGEQGLANAHATCVAVARLLDLAPEQVLPFSTGVILEPLPVDRLVAGLPAAHADLRGDGWFDAAHAIMTTDTVAKQTAVQFQHDGVTYSVGGCAKGSGMIHPNMATMLSFLTTDAAVEQRYLQSVLGDVVEVSYNMMTIDGDTSPEDLVLLLANGAAANGGGSIDADHPAAPVFRAAVEHVAITLARKLARDGEGASKLIEVRVDGAASNEDARLVAKEVAGSSLVKTAVFGNDPNWGRILVAAGNSGARIVEERVSLAVQGVDLYRDGEPLPFDKASVSDALRQSEVRFRIDLGLGDATATAWGCDLTPEYVRINSEYTT